jgi:hypothetical protein
MSAVAWVKSKAREWNRIELKKETDGIDGWYIEKSFRGHVPYRMIQELWKETGNKPINYQDGSSFFVRLPEFRSQTMIRASVCEVVAADATVSSKTNFENQDVGS